MDPLSFLPPRRHREYDRFRSMNHPQRAAPCSGPNMIRTLSASGVHPRRPLVCTSANRSSRSAEPVEPTLTEITAPIISVNKDLPITVGLITRFSPDLLLAGVLSERRTVRYAHGFIQGLGGLQLVWLKRVFNHRFPGLWPLRSITLFLTALAVAPRASPVTLRPIEARLLP
jgi:hypothetical protein